MTYFEELIRPPQENAPAKENTETEVESDMAVRPAAKMTRKQIYDEVWSAAVSGMALKYSIPYSALLKQIKDANIPIPPAGYWTKKEFNKETITIPLPGDPDEVISLYKSSATASRMQKSEKPETEVQRSKTGQSFPAPVPEKKSEPAKKAVLLPQNSQPIALGETETEESRGGRTRNVYRREILYQEVWQFPVTEVAKKYSVSDVAIHKICKSLDIPTPPPGYWAKRRSGKDVSIPPLPQSDGLNVKTGLRTPNLYTQAIEEQIAHLSEEERITILAVASEMVLVAENEKMHPKVAACLKKAKTSDVPEIVNSIAPETLPRAIRILDTIIKAAGPLGVEVDGELYFSIGKDSVRLHFSESTKEVPHQLTCEEKMAVLEYEDAKKHNRWAREPKIRKYDHQYSGILNLSIGDKRKFRDSKAGQIEDRLGEILIAIFYCINEAKLAREAREEAERKREEELRRKEELRKRYNVEVAKTNALVNMANDYEIACKIRAMVAAAEAQGSVDAEWIAWARAKADWYDPTVAATDAYFGKRDHKETPDKKAPKERWSSYGW